MRRASLFLVIAIMIGIPYMVAGSEVPLKYTICGIPTNGQTRDTLLTSFFDESINLGQFIPANLVVVDPSHMANDSIVCLREDAYSAFLEMRNAMQDDIGRTLYIRSAYRSFDTQEEFKEEYKNYAADPGRSEHQLGTAMDLIGSTRAGQLAGTLEYQWLLAHGQEYGFVQSFQARYVNVTGIPAEAWHWRYVGVDMAKEIDASGIDPNVYLYGLKLIKQTPSIDQSSQALPPTSQVAGNANSHLLQPVS